LWTLLMFDAFLRNSEGTQAEGRPLHKVA